MQQKTICIPIYNPNTDSEENYKQVHLVRGKKEAFVCIGKEEMFILKSDYDFIRGLLGEIKLTKAICKERRSEEPQLYTFNLKGLSKQDYEKLQNLDAIIPEKVSNKKINVFEPKNKINTETRLGLPEDVKRFWRSLGQKRKTKHLVPQGYRSYARR